MRPFFSYKLSLITAFLFVVTGFVKAQTTNLSDLYNEIVAQDSIVFTAFNNRDTAQFKKLFSEDLEFFHDKGGLTDQKHSVDFLKELKKSVSDLSRELIKSGLEVYPIPGYGAMQIGSHRFCHTEKNKQECGTFKFVHIWKKQSDGWRITRVISYDH